METVEGGMTPCREAGCARRVVYRARGLCKTHYGVVRLREGWAGTCSQDDCSYNTYARGMCPSHYDKLLRDPVKRRWTAIRNTYNISIEQYQAMLIAQSFSCAIAGCDKTSRDERGEFLCIDHDHACCPGDRSCGKCVRGLLCTEHNLLAGMLEREDATQVMNYLATYRPGIVIPDGGMRPVGGFSSANRSECPRGHLLIEPNLKRTSGLYAQRRCRACSNTVEWARRRRQKSLLVSDVEFCSYADGRYAKIMEINDGRTTQYGAVA